MTKAAAQFGKRLDNFMRSDDTQEYIKALEVTPSISGNKVVDSSKGRYGGSFGHPKLAVFFARRLDVRFAVWCEMEIDDIIRSSSVGKAAVKEHLGIDRLSATGFTGIAAMCRT